MHYFLNIGMMCRSGSLFFARIASFLCDYIDDLAFACPFLWHCQAREACDAVLSKIGRSTTQAKGLSR